MKQKFKVNPAPEWAKDTIIYEINPRTFTSPNGAGDGSGSGTFNSLMEKLPYIQDLGVTAVWINGHALSTNHFSNIWTSYACKDPRVIDPVLGTPEEFKNVINEAHRRGLKIFLDVTTHGVTNDSPLIDEHPGWFKGGEWGMKDFDYDNSEFREWWIELWVGYVIKFGIDGYRLDGPNGIASDDKVLAIWDTITEKCAKEGYPILVFPEVSRYHFRQNENILFSRDMAGDWNPDPQYMGMQISCQDEGIMMSEGNYYVLRGSRFKFGYSAIFGYNIPIFMSGEEFNANQVSLPNLQMEIYKGFRDNKRLNFYDNPCCQGGDPGGWLLGSWIQWSDLDNKESMDMLNDCKKILKIRKENSDVLHYDRSSTNIVRIACSPKSGAVPYVRFIPGRKAIVIVGNDTTSNFKYTIKVPLVEMGLDGAGIYNVTDLWTDKTYTVCESALSCYKVTVPGDFSAGGGVRAIKIEPDEA